MIERFERRENRIEAFAEQHLVGGDRKAARRLEAQARLVEAADGEVLYEEGATGKGVLFFLLAGRVDVMVKGRVVATLPPGEAFGEFPFLDRSLPYMVTTRVAGTAVVAEVGEDAFVRIANDCPDLWRRLARTVMRRLIGANERVEPVRNPCIFIGHGRADVWRRIKAFVQDEVGVDCEAFDPERRAGLTVVDVLEQMRGKATFAVLIMTAEDATGEGGMRARQNVIHEAGWFQATLGFKRAVMMVEKGVEMFSNAGAVQPIMFNRNRLKPALDMLRGTLAREGQIRAAEVATA